ncbi:hypothetical protein PENTCL1PPCAC_21405, partial [Pristionchus entomophagus]
MHLDIVQPIDHIEAHSNGLIIEKAELIDRVVLRTPVGVSGISSSSEKETITIHANRTINPVENMMLQIIYRGVARMDEYGLDPKFNKSLDSNGPYILASNNFPTGARSCGLNVYSNTEVQRRESVSSRTVTVFEKTESMPTYQLALSINHLSIHTLDIEGFGKVRLISSSNSHKYFAPGPS